MISKNNLDTTQHNTIETLCREGRSGLVPHTAVTRRVNINASKNITGMEVNGRKIIVNECVNKR